ncbi:hypothetical protein H4Q26_015567 [Puccinia striiformis f. sp. tritici PST-130]|nr:hypothetical protein H4Q26_015567 [Puccinia striiformis f. sp. tritici PST-130]
MQFSTGYICILAAFMSISLLQTVAADAEVMSSLGVNRKLPLLVLTRSKPQMYSCKADTTELLISKGAKGKLPPPEEAQEVMATIQTSLISAIDGFLKEPVPPNASGTVFTVAMLYLEKTAGGAGGAAPGGAAAGGKGKKAKRSQ